MVVLEELTASALDTAVWLDKLDEDEFLLSPPPLPPQALRAIDNVIT